MKILFSLLMTELFLVKAFGVIVITIVASSITRSFLLFFVEHSYDPIKAW